MYGLQAETHFDGAHFLTDYYGKCENLHGHRWRVVATIEVERLADDTALMPEGTQASPYAHLGRNAPHPPETDAREPEGPAPVATGAPKPHASERPGDLHAAGQLRADGTCTGPGTMRGMVVDFGVFKRTLKEVADQLDHTFLVEEGSLRPATMAALRDEGFTLSVLPFRTTAENLARWFFDRLAEQGLPVSQVEVDETPNNRAFYAAEGHVGR